MRFSRRRVEVEVLLLQLVVGLQSTRLCHVRAVVRSASIVESMHGNRPVDVAHIQLAGVLPVHGQAWPRSVLAASVGAEQGPTPGEAAQPGPEQVAGWRESCLPWLVGHNVGEPAMPAMASNA